MVKNVTKSKTTTCQPVAIRSGVSEQAIRWISTKKGETHRECLRRKMLYIDCGVDITMGSMTSHCQLIHGINTEIDWDRLLVSQHENLPQAYKVRFLKTTNKCHCPVPG